jgi:hypothetical protein
MSDLRRVEAEWRYYVNHFRNHRDNCTDTPHGRRLARIYDAALAEAERALFDAVCAVGLDEARNDNSAARDGSPAAHL